MSDGSDMGIKADRALQTILGGKEQPTEEEKATPEQVRERVMAAPSPLEKESVFQRFGDEGYTVATDCITKAFLLIEEENPGILEAKLFYPKDYVVESLRGKEYTGEHAVWRAVTE